MSVRAWKAGEALVAVEPARAAPATLKMAAGTRVRLTATPCWFHCGVVPEVGAVVLQMPKAAVVVVAAGRCVLRVQSPSHSRVRSLLTAVMAARAANSSKMVAAAVAV